MKYVLACNAGSSSLKFVVYSWPGRRRLGRGEIDRIGLRSSDISFQFDSFHTRQHVAGVRDHRHATAVLVKILAAHQFPLRDCHRAVHRLVFGGNYQRPVRVTPAVLRELWRLRTRAPLHIPVALAVIRALQRRRPALRHICCFDTTFTSKLPPTAREYAIDRRIAREFGIHRYGYHGLSHAAAVRSARIAIGSSRRAPRLLTVHLGSGCSVTATIGGRPIATSMGMTPLEGLVMGTRAGDLDPGILIHLLRQGMSIDALEHLLGHRSGLLGVSEYSSDMRDILTAAGHPIRGYRPPRPPTPQQRRNAKLALALFIQSIRKYLAIYAAELGSVDAVVFTGAIGERNAHIRRLVLRDLHLPGHPRMLVVRADEEGEMVRLAARMLG